MHKYILCILLLFCILTVNVRSNYKAYSVSLAHASSTHQVGYACSGGLIKIGDSTIDLMTKCDKPDDIEMRIAAVGIIQVWIYLNRYMSGSNTIMYVTINTLDKISHIKVIR